jgi:hypothetical protein
MNSKNCYNYKKGKTMSDKFQLPKIVSEKNINFIYENMVDIKAHILDLEKQYATLHLLAFFEQFPQVESVYIQSVEIEHNWNEHSYEVSFYEEYLNDKNFKFLEIEDQIKQFFNQLLEDLPSPYDNFEGTIDRTNIKKVFRELMGNQKFDLWQISIEKEHIEEQLLDATNTCKQNGKMKL